MATKFQEKFKRLNPLQKEAVTTIEGPVLVVAGPGSGKTTVLSLRVSYILQNTDVLPSNILCLTFTETGVMAMKKALIEIIGKDAYYVNVSTYHGFALEIIKKYPDKLSFREDFTLLTDLENFKLIDKIIDKTENDYSKEYFDSFEVSELEKKWLSIPYNNRYMQKKAILESIQKLKRENISVEQFLLESRTEIKNLELNIEFNKKTNKRTKKWENKYKNAKKNLELSFFYKTYQDHLKEFGFYDYEDLILYVIDVLKKDNDILADLEEQYLYLLVDEFQDTNGSQSEIIKLLGSYDDSPNIFVVGDDDQAIYRFQGANVENILNFKKNYPSSKIITLTDNYRSSQLILDSASYVISNNKARLVELIPNITKDLVSRVSIENTKIYVGEFNETRSEINFIVKEIESLKRKGVNYSQIAVFYRKNNDSVELSELLLKNNIPINLFAGNNLLEQKVIKQFINLLKLSSPDLMTFDSLLSEVLFYNFLNFDRLDLFKIISKFNYLKKINNKERLELFPNSMFDLLGNKEKLKLFNIENYEKFYSFYLKIIKWKSDSINFTLPKFLEIVLNESGLFGYIFGSKSRFKKDTIEEGNDLVSFFEYAQSYAKSYPKKTFEDFLNDLSISYENNISIPQSDLNIKVEGVNLMTVHKSKGLEFDYVFLYKANNNPWGGKTKGDFYKIFTSSLDLAIEPLEDERRLFFVALTRAKKKIYITYSKFVLDGEKEQIGAQFIEEIPDTLKEKIDNTKYELEDFDTLKTILSPLAKSPYSIKESDYLKNLLSDFSLSASSLNKYIECPLKFKMENLLKIPTVPERRLYLGTAIHYALEKLYKNIIDNQKISLESFLFFFKKKLQKEVMTQKDFDETLKEGKTLLTDYYNNYNNSFKSPLEVEYSFYNKKIYFEVRKDLLVRLNGKIDKIEKLPTSDNVDLINVVDYKTSVPIGPKTILKEKNGKLNPIYRQILFYKLLLTLDKSFKTIYKLNNPVVSHGTIDFVKPDYNKVFKKTTLELNDKDFKELKEEIQEVVENIYRLQFTGNRDFPLCGECIYCKS